MPDGLPFVARFDDSGNHIWHRSFGTSTGGLAAGVAQSPQDEVYVLGITNSPTLDIGTGPITAGQGKSFLLKLGK